MRFVGIEEIKPGMDVHFQGLAREVQSVAPSGDNYHFRVLFSGDTNYRVFPREARFRLVLADFVKGGE